MTSYDYTSFSSAPDAVLLTYSQVLYDYLIYIFVHQVHVLRLRPSERKRLSDKNTTGEIIDLHLFMWGEAEHPPPSALGSACEGPKGVIAPVCPVYGASKLWTGAAICFHPPLNFIYSPSLAITPKIYDLDFN